MVAEARPSVKAVYRENTIDNNYTILPHRGRAFPSASYTFNNLASSGKGDSERRRMPCIWAMATP